MGKAKGGYYAVAAGHKPGIYTTWGECKRATSGYKGAKFKKFDTMGEAQSFCTADQTPSYNSITVPSKVHAKVPSKVPSKVHAKVPSYVPSKLPANKPKEAAPKPASSYEEYVSDEEADDDYIREEGGFSPGRVDGRTPSPVHSPCHHPSKRKLSDELSADIGALIKEDEEGMRKRRRVDTVVYTDGSCLGNGAANGRAGAGVWWGDGDSNNVSERLWGVQTNNRAELWAAIRAIQIAQTLDIVQIEIRTDSKYTIQGITSWIIKWKRNGWKTAAGAAVLNADLFSMLDKLCQKVSVKWTYVPAHVGEHGNESADILAKEGAMKKRPDEAPIMT